MLLSLQTGNVVDELGFAAGYRLIRSAGFEAIDWNIDHAWNQSQLRRGDLSGCIFEKNLDEILSHYSAELGEIRSNGLTISQAHAPFPAYLPGVPGFLDYAIRIYEGCIRLCEAVGCRNLVIHGVSASPEDAEPPDCVDERNRRLYTSLIPALRGTHVTVCLENLFVTSGGQPYEGVCSDPLEAARAIDALNAAAGRECFGLCLDTGHLHLLRKNPAAYIRTVGRRIRCLHLHDNNGSADQHLMPFAGSLRWNELLSALHEAGYQGDVSFETFAQVARSRMDPAFLPVFLEAIAGVGKIFIARLGG